MKTDCKRLHVTAIGTNEEGVSYITTNGNYNPEGCTGEPGNCGCVHAEEELLKVMRKPKVVILSHSPCIDCAKKLWEAGVVTVIYNQLYRSTEGRDFLRDKGVELIYIGSWG